MTDDANKRWTTDDPVELEDLEELMESEALSAEDLTDLMQQIKPSRSPIWEGLTDRDTGLGRTLNRLQNTSTADLSATGGDLDTDQYLAKVSGEEAVGGSTPTPDQNVVDELVASAGIEIRDSSSLHTTDMLEQRDAHRWELEVESSEDYDTRQE
jgi:hypothetical protein